MPGWLKSLKSLVLENLLAKVTAVFLGGNMGQKVAVVLGLLAVVIGIWQAFVPLVIAVAGLVIVQLAIRDYENARRRAKGPPPGAGPPPRQEAPPR